MYIPGGENEKAHFTGVTRELNLSKPIHYLIWRGARINLSMSLYQTLGFVAFWLPQSLPWSY